jgi:hypothetical protein
MKVIYLLFYFLYNFNAKKIIKNKNIPACRSCIYYEPNISSNDFTSTFSKCTKFYDKDIITDKLSNNYADSARNNEELCGKEGRYYKEEKNLNRKIFIYRLISNPPIFLIGSFSCVKIFQLLYIMYK